MAWTTSALPRMAVGAPSLSTRFGPLTVTSMRARPFLSALALGRSPRCRALDFRSQRLAEDGSGRAILVYQVWALDGHIDEGTSVLVGFGVGEGAQMPCLGFPISAPCRGWQWARHPCLPGLGP